MSENKVIVIAGPTASGKSALAVDAAKFLHGAVVNADSMQVYKHMPIISACPDEAERQSVPHYLFEIYEPQVRGNVVDWLNRAAEVIKQLWNEGKTPVVVGGTGLYLDNLINGTTPIPETPADIREQVAEIIKQHGNLHLYNLLKEVDPEAAKRLSINDSTRLRRAYEVWLHTGRALSEWHKIPMIKKLPEAKFTVIKICPPVAELDERCYLRFDKMINQGALKEIEYLAKLNLNADLPAMKALGVPELLAFVKGECSLDEAIAEAKLHTRQYAKRQRTWFNNKLKADFELKHCYTGDFAEVKSWL